MKKIGVFAGSFDPITNGHLYILKQALKDFDEIIMLVAINPDKVSFFSLEDKVSMIKDATKDLKNVSVYSHLGYTVEFARSHGAKYLIRGIRSKDDLEYEKILAGENKKLAPEIETVYYHSDKGNAFISSSLIRDKIIKHEDISIYVPSVVVKKSNNI